MRREAPVKMAAAAMRILKIGGFLLLFSSFTDAKMEIISSTSDVLVGEDQLLLCKAGAEGEITWQKNGEDVDGDIIEHVDETTSKLTIKKAKLQDSGSYTCLCEFESGHSDKTSLQIFVYERPSFGQTKLHHEFLLNETVIIPCMVTGKPAVDVTWKRDSVIVSADGQRLKVLENHYLQIMNIQREDQGTYYCEGKIKGRQISEGLLISVVINASPTVKIHEEVKKVLAGPETNVSIICLVTGSPTPSISWTTPTTSDNSRYKYNSDKSELTILSVARSDYGEYVCTATNKIGENSATLTLDVSEHPLVFLSQHELQVEPGVTASVSCNATGHPTPTLKWIRQSTQDELSSNGGRKRVEGPELIIDAVAPSDGGLYSCIADSTTGTTTKDFSLQTWPGTPDHITVTPGPTSAHFHLNATLIDGGSPIIKYTLQWRKIAEKDWSERVIQSTDPLLITALEPYTNYSVRFATQNNVGQGEFSSEQTIRTQAKREPDSPILTSSEGSVDKNSYSIPFKQLDDGGSPIKHYTLRYKVDKEDKGWREHELASDAKEINLHDLRYNSDYHLEIVAINSKGPSNSAKLNFTIGQPSAVVSKSGLGKGGVVGIVMLIFLILLIAVDVTCCYTNRCGLLMFLAVKMFGQKVPGMKVMEEGDGNNSTVDELKLNGLEVPRGSIPKRKAQNGAQNGAQLEVTCDKAPLTKFEKAPANGDPATEA